MDCGKSQLGSQPWDAGDAATYFNLNAFMILSTCQESAEFENEPTCSLPSPSPSPWTFWRAPDLRWPSLRFQSEE